jgi:hypothetical protein
MVIDGLASNRRHAKTNGTTTDLGIGHPFKGTDFLIPADHARTLIPCFP